MISMQKKTSGPRIAVGGLLLAALGATAGAEEFQMDLGPHQRQVRSGGKLASSLSAGGRYWLVARDREGGVHIDAMAEAAGLKIGGVHRDRQMLVYEVELSGDPAKTLAKLGSFPEFFALEPILDAEKIRERSTPSTRTGLPDALKRAARWLRTRSRTRCGW